MVTPKERPRERCWVMLGTDGRHVTLGWHSDLTEWMPATERGLASQRLTGRLAVDEDGY